MKCPECDNEKVIAEGDGIMSCGSCSLIFDSGPQWMKYKPSTLTSEKTKDVSVSTNSRTVLKWQNEIRTNISLGKNILSLMFFFPYIIRHTIDNFLSIFL